MPRGRRDASERAIIDALTMAGCTVLQLEDPDQEGVPDLLVKAPGENSRLVLLEVKTKEGRPSAAQIRWHTLWFPHVWVARSPEKALDICGVRG